LYVAFSKKTRNLAASYLSKACICGFHNLRFSLRQETVVFKGLPFHNKPTITISGG